MNLIKAFAIALKEDKDFKGVWPEPATSFTQDSTWGGAFDVEVPCTDWTGNFTTSDLLEFENGPFLEEYQEGETITKEEYLAFTANPNWYEDMIANRPALVAEIADLNKQVGVLVNKMASLADEAGVDVEVNLGQFGSVDVNSDWNSSRC